MRFSVQKSPTIFIPTIKSTITTSNLSSLSIGVTEQTRHLTEITFSYTIYDNLSPMYLRYLTIIPKILQIRYCVSMRVIGAHFITVFQFQTFILEGLKFVLHFQLICHKDKQARILPFKVIQTLKLCLARKLFENGIDIDVLISGYIF